MEKILKFPEDLLSGCSTTAVLRLDGASVIGQCIVTAGQHGTFFLRQHMLYVVLGGKVVLRTGHQRVTLHKNEMVMLRKYSTIEYSKSGNGATGVFESMLFAIRDDFLREFLSKQNLPEPHGEDAAELGLKASAMNEQLVAYCRSLEPYFSNSSSQPSELLKLKMMELFYGVAGCSLMIMRQMQLFVNPRKADIRRIVEEHYDTPVTIDQLAWMSGRSLSSFKRDFMAIYHEAPARWIRERRMAEAHRLLQQSDMSIADVGYSLGYESPAYFSNAFRHRFGVSPSQVRG